jgi:hypothetical protein
MTHKVYRPSVIPREALASAKSALTFDGAVLTNKTPHQPMIGKPYRCHLELVRSWPSVRRNTIGLSETSQCSLVSSGIFTRLSFRRPRDSHGALWNSLGEPHILGDLRTTYPARTFIWSKQCRDLNGPVLTSRARFSRCCGFSAAVLGFVLISVLVVPPLLHAI